MSARCRVGTTKEVCKVGGCDCLSDRQRVELWVTVPSYPGDKGGVIYMLQSHAENRTAATTLARFLKDIFAADERTALEAEAAELRATLAALADAVERYSSKTARTLSEYEPLAMAVRTARTVLNSEAPEPAEAPQEEPAAVTMECEGACKDHYGQVRRVRRSSDGKYRGTLDYCEEAVAEDRRRGFVVTYVEPAEAGGEEGR